MAGEAQDNTWPIPKFFFKVHFGSQDSSVSFQEVSGLDKEVQPLEYRHTNGLSTIDMPGLSKVGNVTLKRGLFMNNNSFWQWYDSIKMNTIKPETVIIQLLDETGSPTMTWTLTNAWPTKISGADVGSDGNEVAVETLELSHEGLTIRNGG